MTNTYRYTTTDGRTIFSPKPLLYALSTTHTVDIDRIHPEDANSCSIIADDYLAEIFAAAKNTPEEETLSVPNTPPDQSWYLHNYCKTIGNKVYIRDGKNYKALTAIMANADAEQLKYILTQTAMQAALCRAELLANEVVAG